MKDIRKIVLTGGDCSGKSTSAPKIREYLERFGWKVIIIPESATEIFSSGMSLNDLSNIDFQFALASLQLAKEKVYMEAAMAMSAPKVLLLCDRGLLDSKAYMSEADFTELCRRLSVGEINYRDTYTAITHLVTAANGAEEAFWASWNNNPVRPNRTIEEVIDLDRRTQTAWLGHNRLRVVDNSTDFQEKIRKAVNEVAEALGIPEKYEIERKFLISKPNIEEFTSLYDCKHEEIVQTYLISPNPNEEARVRRRGQNGDYAYTKTIKSFGGIKRIEREENITKKQYEAELAHADPALRPVLKKRYSFVYHNQYFELDIYPSTVYWQNHAILEIELRFEDETIAFPESIDIVMEVTDNPNFRNKMIASFD